MFVIGDYCISRSFPSLIEYPHNNPTILANLERVDAQIKRIYKELGACAIKITSGYRGEKLNKAVGGKPTSKHTMGLAVDYVSNTDRRTTKELYKWCVANLEYDKLLYEGDSWIHLQLAPDGVKPQMIAMTTDKFGKRLI